MCHSGSTLAFDTVLASSTTLFCAFKGETGWKYLEREEERVSRARSRRVKDETFQSLEAEEERFIILSKTAL
ncbi:hypothetical protein GRJ2_000180500 [Grus japonensis]|uniref:Uncharacterized protein n=1 Tax=Grus japonensis TaxID=30415 RepID=A0ABC9VVB4_GRUJA